MRKQLVAAMSVVLLSACTAGMYSGSGWTEIEDSANREIHPSFGFSVDTCHDEVEGVFTFSDASWERHPVNITGHILNFGDLENSFDPEEIEIECGYFALMEYNSIDLDEEWIGSGHAIACFTEDESHVLISIQSGPFVGYEELGVIHGVMVHHDCGDLE